jgi:hypothetical protein
MVLTDEELLALGSAIQGVAVLILAVANMWNTRRLREISRAVTRIENEADGESGLRCQKTLNLAVSDPAGIGHATETV